MQLIGPMAISAGSLRAGYPNLPGFQLAAWNVRGYGITGVIGTQAPLPVPWSYRSHFDITVGAAATFADEDFFTVELDSSLTPLRFEYDTVPDGVTSGVAINISALTTATEVRDATVAAINGEAALEGNPEIVAFAAAVPGSADTLRVFNAFYGDQVRVDSAAGAGLTVTATRRVRGYGELLLRNAHRAFVSTGLDNESLYDANEAFVWGWLLPVGAGPHRRIRVVRQDLRNIRVGPAGG